MIKNFNDKETEKLLLTGKSSRFSPSIIKASLRKIDYLNSAVSINYLKILPGNKLEALKGNFKGKFSIRINDQYRIVFGFEKSNAYDIKITD